MNPYQQGQPGAPSHPPYPQMPYGVQQPYMYNIGFSGAPQSFGMPLPYGGMQHPSQYPQAYPSPYPPQPNYPQMPPQQSAYPQQQQQSAYPQQTSYQQQPGNSGEIPQYPQGACRNVSPQFSQSTQSSRNVKKPTPTVVPIEPFNPVADAEALRKAMKGFGTDEKTIIKILTARSNEQRLRIAYEFKTLYGKDLNDDLKSECSGNFKKVIIALMTPLPQFYAQELFKAIDGLGTDEDTLIEVLCTMSNYEIKIIQDTYQSMYNRSLCDDLSGDTSGNFRRLLISLSCANRNEGFEVDIGMAKSDAQALLNAGELRLGTDESTFNAILCQRSFPQLAATFSEYELVTGNPFEKAIKSEFSGDIKDGLLAIVKCVKSRSDFFAERLHKSMAGLGTTDHQLIRVMVTRSEVDLGDIKTIFEAKYGKSLQSWIEGDTSGHYKKCLLALIGCY